MADMGVNICGVAFKNPVIAASGTFGFGREYQNFYEIKELNEKKSAFSLPEIPRKCNGEKFLKIILKAAVERSKFYQWNPWNYCYKKEFFEKNSPINAEKYIPHNEVTFK